ncbi:MAG: CHAT domain-containing protein [Acidobacteria bacterium]|nr:CHAT domain-containing protein [Acidobacteriota bacterium]
MRTAARVLVLLAGLAAGAAWADGFDPVCTDRTARPPAEPFDVECWILNALDGAERDERLARLEAWAAAQPGDPWLQAALGMYWVERNATRAEPLFEAALQGFRQAGDSAAGRYALALRTRAAQRLGREEDVRRGLAQLDALRGRVQDPVTRVRIAIVAMFAAKLDDRVDEAMFAMRREIAADGFDALPAPMRQQVFQQAADAALRLAHYSEALQLSRRSGALCGPSRACLDNRLYFEAKIARFMAAAGLASREEAARATREAYDRAHERKALWAEMDQVCELGRWVEPAEAPAWYERCRVMARDLHCDDVRLIAESLQAVGLARLEPARAAESVRRLREVGADLHRLGLAGEEPGVSGFLAEAQELAGDDAGALQSRRDALRAALRLFERQRSAAGRSGMIAFEAEQFYELAAALLRQARARDEPLPREAFDVLEQFRVRSELDALLRSRIGAAVPATAAGRAGRQALVRLHAELADVQARLQDTAHGGAGRDELERRLERLELQEDALLADLAASDPDAALQPRTATLDETQAALAPDEALVMFQVAALRDLPAWVLLVTRETARAVTLPAGDVEPAIGLYVGLLARRDGSEREAAATLSRALLASWVDTLPAAVRRLVIVPDGRMFEFPLAALPLASGAAAGSRFEITLVSSATAFVAGRKRAGEPLPRAALGLAASAPWPGSRDALERADAADLSADRALRGAIPEVRGLVARLGDASRGLFERAASEYALKHELTGGYGVLHFAVHATSNREHPERSAVLLVPGAADEDGLLQPREIAALPLANRLVVLSACSSAGGHTLRGGGPESLARAFLHAGARAVVGTLWPVRDAESVRFAERFYDALAAGTTAAGALAQAQRALAADGVPAADWAAYVLIGEGTVVLAPGAATRAAPAPAAAGSRGLVLRLTVAFAAAAIALAAWAAARTRGKRVRG